MTAHLGFHHGTALLVAMPFALGAVVVGAYLFAELTVERPILSWSDFFQMIATFSILSFLAAWLAT